VVLTFWREGIDCVTVMVVRPRSAVQIVSGATEREELLAVTGDPAACVGLLRSL
jgi:hypothetical protein